MNKKSTEPRPSPFDLAKIQNTLERTGDDLEQAGLAAAQIRQRMMDEGANAAEIRREIRRLERRLGKGQRR